MSPGKKWAWILVTVGALIVAIRVIGSVGSGDDGGSEGPTTTRAAVAGSTTTSKPAAATTTTEGATRRSLLAAVQGGLVEAEFRALGGASGDVAELDIRRLVDEDLEITVPAGLMLVNAAGAEQDLVVAGLEGLMTGSNTYEPTEVIRLDDDSLRTYLLEAYCAEAHDANPSDGGVLTMGALAGSDLVAVLRAVVDEGVGGDTVLVQAVIWAVTDDVTAGDLEAVGYGLEEGELATARRVIAAAGLDPEAYRLFIG
jgi:hypothetical protein